MSDVQKTADQLETDLYYAVDQFQRAIHYAAGGLWAESSDCQHYAEQAVYAVILAVRARG